MNFTKTIQIDMTKREVESITALAVSGENGSRLICFELLENGIPWKIPADCKPVLAFRTEDGFQGEYDTLPDGSTAVSWAENRVTVELIDQMLAQAGVVELRLLLLDEDWNRAESFRVLLMVERGIGETVEVPEDYYRIHSLAEVNQVLEHLEQTKADGLSLEASGNLLYLTSGTEKLGAGVVLPPSGVSFNGGYADEAGQLHLTWNEEAVSDCAPIALEALDGLSWNLGEYGIYETPDLTLRFVATEDSQRVIQVSVDGIVQEAGIVGRAGEVVLFQLAGLSHGAHTIMAWTEYEVGDVTIQTRKLQHLAMISTGQTPLVAVMEPKRILWEGETAVLRYLVVDPVHEVAAVDLVQLGGNDAEQVVLHISVDRRVQEWVYQANATGQVTLSVDCTNEYGNGSTDMDLIVQPVGVAALAECVRRTEMDALVKSSVTGNTIPLTSEEQAAAQSWLGISTDSIPTVASVEEMVDSSKLYALDGEIWRYETREQAVELENLLDPSTVSLNVRANSSGGTTAKNGSYVATIPVTISGETYLTTTDIPFNTPAFTGTEYGYIFFLDAEKAVLAYNYVNPENHTGCEYPVVKNSDGSYTIRIDRRKNANAVVTDVSKVAYVRMTFSIASTVITAQDVQNSKVVLGQALSYVSNVSGWFSTGMQNTGGSLSGVLLEENKALSDRVTVLENAANVAAIGKRVLYMGDSITALGGSRGWTTHCNNLLAPAISVNTAVNGARWADYADTVYDGSPVQDSSNNVLGNQVEKLVRGKDSTHPNYAAVVDYADFDIIVIACGTNDWESSIAAEIESAFTDSNGYVTLSGVDRTTIAGAFRYCIETLHALYPNAMIFVCTPIQSNETTRTYAVADRKREQLQALARRMSLRVIDSALCGIYGGNEAKSAEGEDLLDGLHPNESGAKKLGYFNADAIMKHYFKIL